MRPHVTALTPGWPLSTAPLCKYVDYVIEINLNEQKSTHCIVCYDPLLPHGVDSFCQQCSQTVRAATFARKSQVAEIPLDRRAGHRIFHWLVLVGIRGLALAWCPWEMRNCVSTRANQLGNHHLWQSSQFVFDSRALVPFSSMSLDCKALHAAPWWGRQRWHPGCPRQRVGWGEGHQGGARPPHQIPPPHNPLRNVYVWRDCPHRQRPIPRRHGSACHLCHHWACHALL